MERVLTTLSLLACLACGRASSPEARQDAENNAAARLLAAGYDRAAELVWQRLHAEGYPHAEFGLALVALDRGEDARPCLHRGDPALSWAVALYASGVYLDAAGAFGQVAADDPLLLYDLVSALAASGADVRVSELVPLFDERDEGRVPALRAAARECADTEHAAAMVAEADYFEERNP